MEINLGNIRTENHSLIYSLFQLLLPNTTGFFFCNEMLRSRDKYRQFLKIQFFRVVPHLTPRTF